MRTGSTIIVENAAPLPCGFLVRAMNNVCLCIGNNIEMKCEMNNEDEV